MRLSEIHLGEFFLEFPKHKKDSVLLILVMWNWFIQGSVSVCVCVCVKHVYDTDSWNVLI